MSSISAITDYELMANRIIEQSVVPAVEGEIVGRDSFTTGVLDDPTVLVLPRLRLWVKTDLYYERGNVAIPRSIVMDPQDAEAYMAAENQADLTIYLTASHAHGRWAKYVRHAREVLRRLTAAGTLLIAANEAIGAESAQDYEISAMTGAPEAGNLAVLDGLHTIARVIKQLALRAVTRGEQIRQEEERRATRRSRRMRWSRSDQPVGSDPR